MRTPQQPPGRRRQGDQRHEQPQLQHRLQHRGIAEQPQPGECGQRRPGHALQQHASPAPGRRQPGGRQRPGRRRRLVAGLPCIARRPRRPLPQRDHQQQQAQRERAEPATPGHRTRERWRAHGDLADQQRAGAHRRRVADAAIGIDHRADPVGGHPQLRQARLHAAERRDREVQPRPLRMRAEPRIVGQAEQCPRALPRSLAGQRGMHVVEADHRRDRHLAPAGQAQREAAGAVARQPGPGPGQQATQTRPVQPARHMLGQREWMGLAVEAKQAVARVEHGGGVVLAGRVAVVGAEHQRHARPAREGGDLGIEFRAGLAARLAEGRGVHGFRPQQGIHPARVEGRARHPDMRVEHLAHDCVGAAFPAQAFVVDDVRLHHRDAQRVLHRQRAQLRAAPSAIAGEQDRQRQRAGQGQAPPARGVATVSPRIGQPLVAQHQHEREHRHAAEVGRLPPPGRGLQAMAEAVAEQLRTGPFAGDTCRRDHHRAQHRSEPTRGPPPGKGRRHDLRLHQRRRQHHQRDAARGADPGIGRDCIAEPGEHRQREQHRHRDAAGERRAPRGQRRHRCQPRHQRDETEGHGESATRIHPEQERAGEDRNRGAEHRAARGRQGTPPWASRGGGIRTCRNGRPGGAIDGGTTRSGGIGIGRPSAS